ncbi:Ig-like domain-containing protein [Butyrivibrio sp. AE3004]|uniref:Ig-like domain-containing protein n=1 Tax=Butyrivibrio sp. AE3004 TaxID=1506994 RepID=UPI00069002ED|nr:Ig-like domain-containing protein [Butyrivibrio sp. AE3004]
MKKATGKRLKRALTVLMSVTLTASGAGIMPDSGLRVMAENAPTVISDEQVSKLTADASYNRTSVHDPSIVYDSDTGTYYVFGSHLAVSKSTDLMNWTSIYTDDPSSGIFVESYNEEFKHNNNEGEYVPGLNSIKTEQITIIPEKNNSENAESISGSIVLRSEINGNEFSDIDVSENEAIEDTENNKNATENVIPGSSADSSEINESGENEISEVNKSDESENSEINKSGEPKSSDTKGKDATENEAAENGTNTDDNKSSAMDDAKSTESTAKADDGNYDNASKKTDSNLDSTAEDAYTNSGSAPENDVNNNSKAPETSDVLAVSSPEDNDAAPITAENGIEYKFANYDIAKWISGNSVKGNMWAPDVIYNESLGKWCMYLSLNGPTWNSAIVLLTSDNIEGPYDYVGPVVFSGFSTADSSKSFKNTDLEFVTGELEELPARYDHIRDKSWGDYLPHAIDPAVFYDEDGKLWMVYGSWSGGIYVLELDENTGLRDYTVNYPLSYEKDESVKDYGKSILSDPYFGTKIAGGYYVSGEGPYIEHIGDYYYLFISYGFYSPEGGYNMRVFRSKTPNGPYVDENGTSAIFDKYILNYSPTDKNNNRGEKIVGNYQWPSMSKAEIAQGHNSAIAANDGKIYLIYHTKFNDGTASHEVRVHQMFVNEDGWLVAAPYEYAGETISATGYDTNEIAGEYGLITHDFQMNYGDLAYNTPEDIVLNPDGTITGAVTGTWKIADNSSNCTITIEGTEYKGVFVTQNLTGSNIPVMTFTAVSKDGLSIWGSGKISDEGAVAMTAASGTFGAPSSTFGSISLPSTGLYDTQITWTSKNKDIIADDGTVTPVTTPTDVVMTQTIAKGNYSYSKNYTITVKPLSQNETDSLIVGEYFKDEEIDLSSALVNKISVPNPFNKNSSAGLNLSGGVKISFDTKSTGNINTLSAILSFMGNGGDNGRMYFTSGSYLGYNAGGSWYDANLNNYTLVKDYIGKSAHVDIILTATNFEVYVDNQLCYDKAIIETENGAGTLTDHTDVLKWLYNSADTLYFGSGSWWSDAANNTISNVVLTVNPIDPKVDLSEKESGTPKEDEPKNSEADEVTYTKDKVELTSNSFLAEEENPFHGKNLKKVILKYTINIDPTSPKNGWDGIFSFFKSSTGGRVSMQTNPYLCYNSDGWMDINQPGESADNMITKMEAGKPYDVVVTISTDGIEMTVSGNPVNCSINGSTTSYEKILKTISEADKLTFGVGLASTSYWNTEICTLSHIEFTSVKDKAEEGTKEEEKDPAQEPNEKEDTPKEGEDTPKQNEDTPKGNEDSPKETTDTPKGNEDAPKENADTPKGTEDTPKVSEDTSKKDEKSEKSSAEKNEDSKAKETTPASKVETSAPVAVTGIKLNKSKIKIGRGGSYQLTATVLPSDATVPDVEFSSSNTKIATVTSTGLIKAKKNGKCTITAKSKDGNFTAKCSITVKDPVRVTKVKLNKSKKTLKLGKSFTLKAKVKPTNATIKDVTWSTSNKKIAKVDANGNVIATGKGTATITAKTKDGSYTATCKITVK